MNTKLKSLIVTFMFVALSVSNLPAQTCNDSLVYEIDRIKQNVETMLINSITSESKLETGETLLAFYIEGHLIKLTVDNSDIERYSTAELFFKDGFLRHIAEEYLIDGLFIRNYYYFNDDKLICYQDEKSGDYEDAELYSIAEKKWLEKVDRYLFAIQ